MWLFLPFAAYILHIFPVAAMAPVPNDTTTVYLTVLGIISSIYVVRTVINRLKY